MKTVPLKSNYLYLFLSIFKIHQIFFIIILWLIFSQILVVSGFDLTVINLFSLLVILITCLGCFSYQLIFIENSFFHPITWFFFTSALYFGFGPLLYYFGSIETINFVDNYYLLSADALFQINSIIFFGLLSVIFFYLLLYRLFICKFRFQSSKSRVNVTDTRKLSVAANFLIIIGVPMKIAFTLPYAIGIFDWHLPGFLKNCEHFSVLALIPLYLIKNVSLRYKTTFYVLTIFNFFTAFVTLSKLSVIIIMFVLFLAAKLKGSSNFRLGLAGLLILLIYAAFLSPIVTFGRSVINVGGVNNVAGLQRLIGASISTEPYDLVAAISPGVNRAWARLNYANAQAFAVQQYDSGNPGDTLSDILWVLVPRTLFPDKPNLSYGSAFNELVDGNPNSSSGPAMIMEGYWNAGWAGVIFVCFITSLIYVFWEKYIIRHLRQTNFQYLPVMFLGLFSALTQDSWFVMNTFAIIPVAIAMHFTIRILYFCFSKFR